MWHGGPHTHGLLRLYRFRDQDMEQAYCEEANSRSVRAVYLHSCGMVLFSVVNCASFAGGRLTAGFWLYFATCVAAILLALVVHFVPLARRNVIPAQAAFSCLLGCLLSAMIPVQYASWAEDAEALRPVGYPLAVTDHLLDYVRVILARQSILYCWVWVMVQCVPLALAGLRVWTIVAYSCTFVAFVSLTFLCPVTITGVVNCVILTLCGLLAFALLSSVLERSRRCYFLAQSQLAQELHASQLADSVLNHTLKNILADVAANLEVFLAGAADHSLLEDSVACLRRGMRSCKDRQVYLKLTAGNYQPTLKPVRLSRLAQQVGMGRPIMVQAPRTTVLVDTILLSLVLENAISNAFRHGSPKNPDVHLTIIEEPEVVPGKPGYRRYRFTITNAVHPDRPRLTPAYVQDLLAGKVCRHPGSTASPLSYGVGLSHCMMAARRGGIQLDLWEEGDRVVFTACVDAPRTPYGASPDAAEADAGAPLPPLLPEGLRIHWIDDSVAAQRLLAFHIQRSCPSATFRCYGAREDDVATFLSTALTEADIVIMDQNLDYPNVTYYGNCWLEATEASCASDPQMTQRKTGHATHSAEPTVLLGRTSSAPG
eukprot:EG_transcript_1655